ncbi:hypothetical protein ACH4SP_04905 [Streptomyces sp. NPDC021093]|uniref:hypothetical protein n=1 Tax=Streptomyces sp. NPDC021093 TaxID=3365112 RepID=UPI0037A1BF6D
MRISRLGTVLVGAIASTLLAITPSSAVSWEVDHATATSGPGLNGFQCSTIPEGGGCFRPDGDWFAVSDFKADKHSVLVRWKSFDPRTNALHRQGTIWNSSGKGTSRYQNKNLPEGDFVEWEICTGDWDDLRIITCGGTTSAHA